MGKGWEVELRCTISFRFGADCYPFLCPPSALSPWAALHVEDLCLTVSHSMKSLALTWSQNPRIAGLKGTSLSSNPPAMGWLCPTRAACPGPHPAWPWSLDAAVIDNKIHCF